MSKLFSNPHQKQHQVMQLQRADDFPELGFEKACFTHLSYYGKHNRLSGFVVPLLPSNLLYNASVQTIWFWEDLFALSRMYVLTFVVNMPLLLNVLSLSFSFYFLETDYRVHKTTTKQIIIVQLEPIFMKLIRNSCHSNT